MLSSTEFINLEEGLYRSQPRTYEPDDSDWGLFIILDMEEENIQVIKHKKQRQKHIIPLLDTIQEDDDDYIYDTNIYNKMEYYKTTSPATTTNNNEPTMNQEEQEKKEDEEAVKKEDEEEENNIIKNKIQFFITYALTTSFSVVLIFLTFAI